MANRYTSDDLEPIKIEGQIDLVSTGSIVLPQTDLINKIDEDRKKIYPPIFKKIVEPK
jgi:hypothetical protein